MRKVCLAVGLSVLVCSAVPASAATLVNFEGNATDNLATGTASLSLSGNTLTGTITNTSPGSPANDARIMGFGFDIAAGDLNGFTGSANAGFLFSDDDFGNVPQFNGTTIDFGAAVNCSGSTADNNCSLNGGGSPNNGLDFGQMVTFTATGPFGMLTEAQIASALFVRFQRVGPDGVSDVARPELNQTAVPEPASMILLGTGLLAAFRARKKAGPQPVQV